MMDHQVSLQSISPAPAPFSYPAVGPERVFADPDDVLAAPDLTRDEKRAILAGWASDAWAVESAPALRHCPGLPGHQVPLDDVLQALRSLDREDACAVEGRPQNSGTRTGYGSGASRMRRMAPGVHGKSRVRWLAPPRARESET